MLREPSAPMSQLPIGVGRPPRPSRVAILPDRIDRLRESNFGVRILTEPRQQEALQLLLLALQPIGMAGLILENPEIELGALAGFLQSNLPAGRDQPLRHELGAEPEPIEHVEGRRMKRRGAQIVRNRRIRLEQNHRHPRRGKTSAAVSPTGPPPTIRTGFMRPPGGSASRRRAATPGRAAQPL